MPDNGLIQLPPLTTTEAPTPKLSKADIAAPYASLAQGMNAIGEGITDEATALAEQAGHKAVRTDDAGNLVVDKAPLIGPASAAYARAARMTELARLEPDMQNKLTELRLANPNNPEGYKAAAGAYLQTVKGQINDPVLAGAVEKAGSEASAHNYRTSLIETDHHNTAEWLQAMQSRLKDINERSASLARQGGTDTPEYASLASSRQTIWNELGSDPRSKISPDRIALEMKESRDQDIVQSIIGEATRQFGTKKNAAEAQKFLQDRLLGPGSEKLNLTMVKRERAVVEGLHSLSLVSAQDREAVAENKTAATAYVASMKDRPGAFDEGEYQNMLSQAERVGDVRSADDLREAKRWLPTWQSLKAMGPAERARSLQQMDAGINPGREPPNAFAMTELGATSRDFYAARGHGHIEGMNPEFAGRLRTAVQDAEAATGETAQFNSLFRTRDEQADAYARYLSGAGGLAAAPGHSRHETGNAADIQPGKVLNWLHDHAADYGLEFLQGKAFYKDPVHIQMAGAGGGIVPGTRADFSAAPATARLFQATVKDLRAEVARDADREFEDIKDRLTKNITLRDGQLQQLGQLAVMSGKTDLVEKLQPDLMAADKRAQLPDDTSYTALHSAIEHAQSLGLGNIERRALEKLDDDARKDFEELHKEPLVHAAKAGWSGPLNQLDPSNPAQVAQEISRRNEAADIVRDRVPGFGPINALTAEEGDAVAKALTQGDPKNAAHLMQALRMLQPDDYRATIGSDKIKQAIVGMASSADPARMESGMGVLDQEWRRNPAEFQREFGEAGAVKLMAWLGLRDQFPAGEVAQRINTANDPSMMKAIEERRVAAEKELTGNWIPGTGWSTYDIIAKMTEGVQQYRTYSSIHRLEPPQQLGPYPVAGMLHEDFNRYYMALRTYYGVEPAYAAKYAAEVLNHSWGMTYMPTMGSLRAQHNMMMKYPPEKYYPAIDGSRDWMYRQLSDALDEKYGKPESMIENGVETMLPRWFMKGVISDAQTEAEINSGKPPSYLIAINDRPGQMQIVAGPDGQPMRFRWNHETAVKAALPGLQVGVQRGQAAVRALDAASTMPPMQ